MKRTLHDVDVAEKRVLVRVDYNVPLDERGALTDTSRIRETLPTLRYLREAGARIILISHLGRPDGKEVPTLSLEPVARELRAILGAPVAFAHDILGPDASAKIAALGPGDVVLLENVRFHAEEEENNKGFARALAQMADVYVNDAFGTAHRAHASTAGVAAYLPSAAGLLMEREVAALGQVLESPKRPLVAIVGGAKVSSKLGVLENLLSRVDALLIGGGMACTFLKAKGLEVGRSLLEEELVPIAREMMGRATREGIRLDLPVDVVCADRIDDAARTVTVDAERIPPDMMAIDIGPASVARFTSAIAGAGTILWNGPMGVFERPPFAAGTQAIARAVADSGAISIVGGGDTAAAIEQYSDPARFSHVSTGGGAALELLEGRTLPGVEALSEK